MLPRHSVLALVSLLALAGCNTTADVPTPQPAPQQQNYVTRPDFRLPEGQGCSGEIARFRAVMDNDLSTGNVNRDVHGRVMADLRGPEGACAANRSAEALAGLRTVKSRYGYP